MSRVAVGTAEAGRPCPACRFPLRHGTVAERCDACGALHHEECWREAGGCAVEGCAGGETAVMPAAAPPPPPAAPLSSAAAPPPPPPPAVAPAPNRGVALGLLVGLALAGAALAGYLVARGGGDETPIKRTAVVSTDEGPSGAAQPGETASSSEQQEDPQHQAMERMVQIVRLSLVGRTAVREGRYAEAIANRELVLQRLDALHGARGAVARAQATLRAAMEASLASDRAYAEGRGATASDRAATAYKRDFVAQWNPLAGRYGLEPYAEGEI
jgi:hypothetical protein